MDLLKVAFALSGFLIFQYYTIMIGLLGLYFLERDIDIRILQDLFALYFINYFIIHHADLHLILHYCSNSIMQD